MFCACYYDSSLSVHDTQTDSLVAVYPQVQHLVDVKLASSPELGRIYVPCQDAVLAFPDTPPGVEEGQVQAPSLKPQASIVHGVLFLPEPPLTPLSSLLSVDGRKVMNLRTGANDVSRLNPGVYFLRGPVTEDGRPDVTRKVVITK